MKNLLLFTCFILFTYKVSTKPINVNDTTVYGSVQNNYPGGQDAYNKYISENAQYPAIALQNNIQGCSYLVIVIEKDGSLSYCKVFRGVGSGMDEAAVKVIKSSGKWIPNKVNGEYVRTKCKLAVNFTLTSDPDNKLIGTVNGNASKQSILTGTDF